MKKIINYAKSTETSRLKHGNLSKNEIFAGLAMIFLMINGFIFILYWLFTGLTKLIQFIGGLL